MITRLPGPSGSTVFLEENRDLPLVRAQVTLRSGAVHDPVSREGLANFSSELLTRGAGGLSRADLDEAFDALGASLGVSTDFDSVVFDFTVLPSNLDSALGLLATVLLRPDFPDGEAAKLKRELLAQLDDLREDDGSLSRRFFQRALYDGHPYGRTVLGTRETIEALSVDEARGWHAEALRGGNVVFGLAGEIAPDHAEELLRRHFGALAAGPSLARASYPPPPRRPRLHLTLVDKPERTQSQILLGHGAPHWSDPLFLPLIVGTTAFGGTFTARLMDEVRVKRGLSYGASARVGQGRGAKALVMHVFPSLEQTPETLALVLRLYRELSEGGLRDAEVEFARGYLAAGFAFGVATPEDRLDMATGVELQGLPADYAETFPDQVRAVTPAQVSDAIREHTRADELEICVVSTADLLLPLLDKDKILDRDQITIVPYESY